MTSRFLSDRRGPLLPAAETPASWDGTLLAYGWASQSYDDWTVTPTQLRAFSAVVRLGSVKEAAGELGVTEAAVSLHIGHLRKELGDRLFTRTSSGLAFTPGGLRLASRAAELAR